ncbi:acyltransferase [Roseomonas sp. GC11]|uniref:acyltransferase family protein n=1 Tax=Roseomonas sp. GC11 TaxID=2950546 RepID=UPI00210E9314|nr:acyltransferase [Roseomonas sp. GC11]MCQ4160057.1 acyltransferase [Roseomonas sp. GC11]
MILLSILVGFLACFLLAGWLARQGAVPLPPASGRLGCIDGLRGYLALGVVVHHFAVAQGEWLTGQWEDPPPGLLVTLGQGGVILFFMVTGCLFAGKARQDPRQVEWGRLYLGRLFRLGPMMWFATALLVLLAALASAGPAQWRPAADALAILAWLGFLASPDLFGVEKSWRIVAGVTWTLRFEWAFYLALPLLGLVLHRGRRLAPPGLLLGAGLLLSYLLFQAHMAGLLLSGIPGLGRPLALAPLFLTGLCVAVLREREELARLLRGPAAALAGTAALAAMLFLFPTAYGAAQYLLLTAFFLPVACGNPYFGLLRQPASIVLGEISYSLYLLHGLVLFTAFHFTALPAAGWSLLPPLMLLTTLAASLTHRLVERPGIALGRRLAARRVA